MEKNEKHSNFWYGFIMGMLLAVLFMAIMLPIREENVIKRGWYEWDKKIYSVNLHDELTPPPKAEGD